MISHQGIQSKWFINRKQKKETVHEDRQSVDKPQVVNLGFVYTLNRPLKVGYAIAKDGLRRPNTACLSSSRIFYVVSTVMIPHMLK